MLLDPLFEVIDDEGYVSMPSGYDQFIKRDMFSDDGETTSKNYSTTTSEFYTVGSYNMKNGKFDHWLNTDDYMSNLMKRSNNSITYFHNIGYDGEFIVWWLLENGFKQVHNVDATYESEFGKVRRPLNSIITEPSFQANIDGMNNWYLLCLYIPTNQLDKHGRKKLKKITLLDSFKIMPMSVDAIAKTFELTDEGEPFRKGDINHELVRRPNEPLDEETFIYLRKDCKIVGDALNLMHKEGSIKSTMSSNSLDTYKRVMWDDEFCEQEIYNRYEAWLSSGDPSKKFKKPSYSKIRDYEFRNIFPVLESNEDEFVHNAYKGGTTQHIPEHTYIESKPEVVKGGIGIDINSSYPDKLKNRPLPYGHGEKFEGEYKFDMTRPLAVFMVEFRYRLKNKKLPFIQHKDNKFFKSTKIQRNSGSMKVTLTVTSVFWRLVQECYDVWDIVYHGGYKYRASMEHFDKFINKFMKIKADNKGVNPGKEFNAKLTMNSLYGKFGSKKERSHKEISIDDNTGLLNFMDVDDEDAETVYTPLACFVTDYGREQLIMTGNSNFDRVLYMDTDSLYMRGSELPVLPVLPGLEGHMKPLKQELHPKELGMWDIETLFTEGKFLRAKTYRLVKYKEIKTENGHIVKDTDDLKTVVKCAGMPEGIKKRVTNENFVLGSSFKPLWKDEFGNFTDVWYQGCLNVVPGKLTPVRVKKGKYLEHRTFTIKFERGTELDELNDKIKTTLNNVQTNTGDREKEKVKLKKMVNKFQEKVENTIVKNNFKTQKSKELLLDKLSNLCI